MKTLPAWLRLTFKGRLNRARYFWYEIGVGLILIITTLVFIGFFGFVKIAGGDALDIVFAILFIIRIVLFAYYVSFTIRRLKDLDKSRWLLLLMFIPFVNVGFHIYLIFFKGTKGPNKYGPDPLEFEEYSDYLETVKNYTPDTDTRFEG